jgi:hypothetical protein
MSWRDVLKIHPAAEAYPPLPHDELVALGNDIKKNRLQNRVKLIRYGGGYAVIDGRNRLDAIEAVGLNVVIFDGRGLPNRNFFEMVDEVDVPNPVAYAKSANAYRRHLTPQQRTDAIIEAIKSDPAKSDRQIAKQTDSSPTTVGKVRDKLETRGDVSTVDTRTDARGRQQPAHRPKLIAPPSDAERSRPAPQEFSGEGDAKDQAIDLERELAAARVRIRQLEERVEELEEMAVQKADKIRALQAALKEKNQSAATPGAPSGFQMEADNRAGGVPSPSFYEAALKTIETFEGSASQLLDWWRSRVRDRAKLALEDQTRLSQLYTAKFRSLPSHEGGTS